MRRGPARFAGALLLITLAGAAPAAAWAPETRIRMAEQAVRMMPASLRLALETHRDPLLRGVLEPLTDEDGAAHRPPWAGGGLDAAIEQRARALVASVEQPAPFRTIARNFGALAHFVMDAGFPPAMTPGAGRRDAHFRAFCESRREKFPLVFYGHADEALDRGAWREFATSVMERSRHEDAQLARAYAAAGEPPDPAHFDDRSVPFAVASLSYSRTVTHIVRAWIAAWREAYGDMGRTPYLQPE